jgi:predicted DNA repair protein MutK
MCAFSWIGDALKAVWGFLLNINSGQIQVVIALAAIWLAFEGYKKVLKQIEMAHDQFKESEVQTKHFAEQAL